MEFTSLQSLIDGNRALQEKCPFQLNSAQAIMDWVSNSGAGNRAWVNENLMEQAGLRGNAPDFTAGFNLGNSGGIKKKTDEILLG